MKGLSPLARAFASLSLIATFAATGRAGTIVYSNIQPGDIFGPGVGIGFIPFTSTFNYAGVGFTAGQDYTFQSMELAASLISGPNVLDVYLMGSLGGLPSGILESFTLNNELSTDPASGLVTIDSVTHPLLAAGMQYWVVAAGGPTTFASWQQNVHNVQGPNVSGPTLTSLVRDPNSNVIEALEVDGTTTPEPASWTLMLGALALGTGYSCYKNRRSATIGSTRAARLAGK